MGPGEVRRWFDAYLEVFMACGRGEDGRLGRLLEHYDVPLLLATDAGVAPLTSEADVEGAIRQQVEGMRATGYARSEVLDARVEVVNRVSALYRAEFSRQRADGSEIGRLRVTYVIAGGRGDGGGDDDRRLRIAALLVHGG